MGSEGFRGLDTRWNQEPGWGAPLRPRRRAWDEDLGVGAPAGRLGPSLALHDRRRFMGNPGKLPVSAPGWRVQRRETPSSCTARLPRDPTAGEHEAMPTLARSDVTLAYEVCGAGPPLFMIQGVGAGGGGWRPQVDGLCGGYRILTFDNRGFGRSTPCRGPISIEAMAGDVVALMEAAGWAEAHLVGHSMGGASSPSRSPWSIRGGCAASRCCAPSAGRRTGRA
jgi:hypothetical protein